VPLVGARRFRSELSYEPLQGHAYVRKSSQSRSELVGSSYCARLSSAKSCLGSVTSFLSRHAIGLEDLVSSHPLGLSPPRHHDNQQVFFITFL